MGQSIFSLNIGSKFTVACPVKTNAFQYELVIMQDCDVTIINLIKYVCVCDFNEFKFVRLKKRNGL